MFSVPTRFVSLLLGRRVAVGVTMPCALALAALSAPGALTSQVTHSAPVRSLPNGMRVQSAGQVMELTALRDDVIRVRVWPEGREPENASWAVLPAALHSTTPVTPEAHGFATDKVHVSIGPNLAVTVSDLSGHVLQQDAEPIVHRGKDFRVYKQLTSADHFFGLGDKPGPLDRTGEAFTMWNTDHFAWQESTDPIYKSVPFFLQMRQGRALGVFFNNTFRSFFDFGRELPNEYSFGATDGPLDYFLLYGPEPKHVLSTYAWLTGPTPLPPLWSLGFQQSRYTYSPESKLLEVGTSPCAPITYRPMSFGWTSTSKRTTCPSRSIRKRFPDFPQLVKNLAADQFRLIVITDLHIADQPGIGYAPYDSGVASDRFVKLTDASTYVGTVWPGPSVFPDFTQAQTRVWWGSLFKDFVADGIAGFWNDMNEPAVFNVPTKTMPDNVQHRIDEPGFVKRTATHLEIHNVYGMLNSEGTYEGMLKLRPNERPFVIDTGELRRRPALRRDMDRRQ